MPRRKGSRLAATGCLAVAIAVVLGPFAGCALPLARKSAGAATGLLPAAHAATKVDDALRRASFDEAPAADSRPGKAPELSRRIALAVDLGRAKEAEGRWEDALLDYQRAVELARGGNKRFRSHAVNAELGSAYHRMGVACDRLGRFGQAREHYAEALRLRPTDARVWNDAGYSDSLQGNSEEAIRKIKEALRLAPTDARVANNLGIALANAGRVDEAVALVTRHSGPAAAHANVAYVLAAQGKHDLARRHYERAVQFQPSLGLAREALAALDRRAIDPDRIAARTPSPRPVNVATHSPNTAAVADSKVSRTDGARPAKLAPR